MLMYLIHSLDQNTYLAENILLRVYITRLNSWFDDMINRFLCIDVFRYFMLYLHMVIYILLYLYEFLISAKLTQSYEKCANASKLYFVPVHVNMYVCKCKWKKDLILVTSKMRDAVSSICNCPCYWNRI